MPHISIVIPAYNEEKTIGQLLTSIAEHALNIEEILVIDNNCTDKTAEIAEGYPKVRVIKEMQKGVAFARSRGAREAKGDVVAFVDADAYIEQGWEETIQKYFANQDLVCLSGPSLYYDFSKTQLLIAKIYWWSVAAIVKPIIGFAGNFANMVVRKSAYDQIGGINTNIEFYGDDTDIPHRLSKVGRTAFDQHFFVWASGRRFLQEGLIKTTSKYAMNFFSQLILHKPISKGYTEVR